MEDELIIDLFLQRREDAIKETDKKYSAYLKKVISMVLASLEDIEECLNDTYMAVWGRIPPDSPKCFRAYIAKIARNTALNRYDYLTAAKRNPGVTALISELEECLPSVHTVESEVLAGHIREALNSFLYGLPADKRKLFLRRYWFGDSIEDIAAWSGFGKSKIKSILFRIRKELKVYLEKEGIWL